MKVLSYFHFLTYRKNGKGIVRVVFQFMDLVINLKDMPHLFASLLGYPKISHYLNKMATDFKFNNEDNYGK